MYERFTDRARKILALANQEAQRYNHEEIAPHHILFGIAKEGSGIGAYTLKHFGATREVLRKMFDDILESGPDMVTIGKMPQTPESKKVIEHAIENARDMGHNYVGTEHILLGLLDCEETVAFGVLKQFNISKKSAKLVIDNILVGANASDTEANCMSCNKFNICIFAQSINVFTPANLDGLFGENAMETIAEVFQFCGSRCKIFERNI